jgi:probable HAF family extracellular repeat protein
VITGANGETGKAFLRYSDGTSITFGPSDAFFVYPVSINPAGAVTGFFDDPSGGGGFLRAPDGTFTVLNLPGSTFTGAYQINPAGLIIGSFTDTNGVTHGFLFLSAD